MKLLFSLILIVFTLTSTGCGLFSATTFDDEQKILQTDAIIQQDVTWSGTIDIRGVFVVGRGATLTILPGTTVRFHKIDTNRDGIGDSEIRVLGRILAVGTRDNPITFKSAEKNPTPRDWSYVLIFASARKNILQYCLFRDAFTGLQVHFSTAAVSDSIFTHNNEGLRFGRARLTVAHNAIEKNDIGIRFTRMEGPVEITGNIITGNRIGIFLVPSSQNIVDFFEPGRTGRPWNEGHLEISGNNIFANRDYNLNLGVKQKWDLAITGNWWGTTEPNVIMEKIFDKSRDRALGRAIYMPPLEAPAQKAGPR
jgi:parallel beta-helix repeat protein